MMAGISTRQTHTLPKLSVNFISYGLSTLVEPPSLVHTKKSVDLDEYQYPMHMSGMSFGPFPIITI